MATRGINMSGTSYHDDRDDGKLQSKLSSPVNDGHDKVVTDSPARSLRVSIASPKHKLSATESPRPGENGDASDVTAGRHQRAQGMLASTGSIGGTPASANKSPGVVSSPSLTPLRAQTSLRRIGSYNFTAPEIPTNQSKVRRSSVASVHVDISTNGGLGFESLGAKSRRESVVSTGSVLDALAVIRTYQDGWFTHLQIPMGTDKYGARTYYALSLTIACAGRFRQTWDSLILIAVIYCSFIVPWDMCFQPYRGIELVATDVAVEIIFMVDIVFNFMTSYFDANVDEICCKRKIAINYLKGWFVIDMVSSVPAETISLIGGDGSGSDLSALKIVRIVRITKLLRLLRIGKLIENLELTFPQLSAFFGLFRLLFMMTIVAHINACVFYYIATLNMGNSWVSKLQSPDCCDNNEEHFNAIVEADQSQQWHSCASQAREVSLWRMYNVCIYWSFTTLATVGYGDVTPCNHMEIVYATGAMVLGSAMFAYIVGNIASVVTARKGQDLRMQEKMRDLQEYLTIRKIPGDMRDRIRRQCYHRWKKTVFDEAAVLADMTPMMRREVVYLVYGDCLHNIPSMLALSSVDPEFLNDTTVQLQPCSNQPGDLISIEGEEGGDFFLITRGVVELIDSRGVVRELLFAGQHFNELEVFSEMYSGMVLPYVYTARAVTMVESNMIPREIFNEICCDHPATKGVIEDEVVPMLMHNPRYKNRVRGPETPHEHDMGELLIRVPQEYSFPPPEVDWQKHPVKTAFTLWREVWLEERIVSRLGSGDESPKIVSLFAETCLSPVSLAGSGVADSASVGGPARITRHVGEEHSAQGVDIEDVLTSALSLMVQQDRMLSSLIKRRASGSSTGSKGSWDAPFPRSSSA